MLRKIPFETSALVLERFKLSEEGGAVVTAEQEPEAALQALHAGEHMVDMANYFANGMPPREGVCWAVAIMRDICTEMSAQDQEVLALSEKWIKDPQEGLRIRLMDEAEKRESDDPVYWLCNAVAWNGSGSMAPKDGPVVLPPTGLHASALLGAVGLLAGTTEESVKALLDSIYARGLEVAQGGWPMLTE
jgi:hypothetical protein